MDGLPKQFPSNAAIEMVPSRTYSPGRGWVTNRRFKADHDAAIILGEDLAEDGYSVTVEPIEGSPKSLVTASTVGDETDPDASVLTIWTLQANTVEEKLWNHPKVTVWTQAMTIDGLATFRADVEALLRGETPINVAGLPADLQVFIHMLGEGTDAYFTNEWVLRKEQTVSPNTSLEPDQANTLRIFKTAELTAAEAIPGTIVFVLPLGDWLKLCGTVSQLSDGRFQFSQEYVWRTSGGWDERLIYQHKA